MNLTKEIFLPARSLIPVTTTLADAPIKVKLPPKSAPIASAHHNGRTSASGSPPVAGHPRGPPRPPPAAPAPARGDVPAEARPDRERPPQRAYLCFRESLRRRELLYH